MNKERSMDVNLMVSDIISEQSLWDMQKLLVLFPESDIIWISSYQPRTSHKDRFIWAFMKDGCHSVKSGSWFQSKMPVVKVVSVEQLALNKLKA